VKYVYNQTLTFGGLKIDSLNFHVSDYDILSSVYGDRIDGIIGYSFFNKWVQNSTTICYVILFIHLEIRDF